MLALFTPHQASTGRTWPGSTVRSSSRSSRPVARSLGTIWMGFLEGMTAYHRYGEMMRGGIPSDRALRLALGISHAGNCACSQRWEREREHADV